MTPTEQTRILKEKVLPRVSQKYFGCWIWLGPKITGYGFIKANVNPKRSNARKTVLVHRLSYEVFIGAIPEGLQMDHLCKVRECLNPGHLEAVTSKENTLRGTSLSAKNAVKKRCMRGHPFTPANITWSIKGRTCRPCQIARCKRYRLEVKKAKAAAVRRGREGEI